MAPLVAAPTLAPISVFAPWLFAFVALAIAIVVPGSRALSTVAIVHSCESWRMTFSVRMIKRRTRHSVWSFQSFCCVIITIGIIASLTPPLRSPFTPIHLQNWRLCVSSTKAAAFTPPCCMCYSCWTARVTYAVRSSVPGSPSLSFPRLLEDFVVFDASPRVLH